MKRLADLTTTMLAVGVCLIGFSFQAAYAGVEVSPDDDAKVILDGDRFKPGKPHNGTPIGDNAPDGQPKEPALQWHCYIDTEAPGNPTRCILRGFEDTGPDDPNRPTLTPGMVLEATRTLGLPRLSINIQPGVETLVNFDTIFYTRPQAFERTVDLLGYNVDVSAVGISYGWHYGDGSSQTTATAGREYPHKDVKHQYREKADRVTPRVDVTYRVRYRVDGGPWQTIDQTLTAEGPTTNLRVREAIPVLTIRG
ncbi:hypothetical protein BH09ACT10_BH09ACT10_02620 [soil metagenome]